MDQSQPDKDQQLEDSSLENQPTVVEAPSAGSNTNASNSDDPKPPKPKRNLVELIQHANIYLILFVILVALVLAGGVVLYLRDRQAAKSAANINSQSLTLENLDQLANTGVSVGDPKQILTVQSNAIFSGKLLVRSDLEVAGKLLVGSSLSLTGVTVSGNSIFDDVQVSKSLSVNGNAAIQGRLTAGSLATNSNASFGGTVTAGSLVTNRLTLNGDLVLTRHIAIGGATPSRSNGSALGGGGTSSVSGSDSAGTITINTGSSPSAGCFITVVFAKRYNSVPRVMITPVGSTAASVNPYVSRSTASFSVCGVNAAGSSRSFGYDYFIVE
jgi:cytoskeletal protein CcmA (bactofilin family)